MLFVTFPQNLNLKDPNYIPLGGNSCVRYPQIFLCSALLDVTAFASLPPRHRPRKKTALRSRAVPTLIFTAITVWYFQTRPVSLPSVHVNCWNWTRHCSSSLCRTFRNQNVLRDFSTQEKNKTKKQRKTNISLPGNLKTQHEQAFIVLCIYAIVYVWIWRIWKYMLTNLYRVFYVMWNTWSRCSLLFLALHLFLFFCLLFFCRYKNISEGLGWPCW